MEKRDLEETQNADTPKEEEKTEEELKAQEDADNEYLKPNWD